MVNDSVGNRVTPVTFEYTEKVVLAAWPRDPAGWVYLGNAVHKVGAALFDSWKRFYPVGLLPDVLISEDRTFESAEEGDRQRAYASWLLDRRGDDVAYIFRVFDALAYRDHEGRMADGDFTEEEWGRAAAMSRAEWDFALEGRARFSDVQHTLTVAAEKGELTIGMRPTLGGAIEPTPKEWWSTEYFRQRFHHLRIDPSEPFSLTKPHFESSCDLFVNDSGLKALLKRISLEGRTAPQTERADRILSPYMRLMLEVAESLDIRPDHQPKVTEIESVIRSRWPASVPSSEVLIKKMCTLLREPESQAGRGLKDGRK